MRYRRLSLFCLLLGVYLLTYTGQIYSIDEMNILSMGKSLAERAQFQIDMLGCDLWWSDSAYAPNGTLHSNKGLLPSLATVPFVWLANLLPFLPLQATGFLLNPLMTAATAVLLMTILTDIGYSRRVAYTVGAFYGVGTLALVYSQYLFSEPLAAFLLTATVLLARRDGRPWLVGLLVGPMLGINLLFGMYALLFGLWALFTPSNATLRQRLQRGILFSLPVIACILIVGSYNFARLGTVLASGYSPHEGFNQPPHLGLYGLLFSPYRGLFWYSPLLLAALPGWFMLKDRLLAHSTALLSGVTVLAFASWWSWHGGATWGPRFLVTITPLMTLWLAPLLTRKNWLSATTLGLFGASVAVQTLGAFYDYKIFIFDHQNATYWTGDVESIVTMLSPQVLYRLSASAITGHAQMLLNGTPPNFAWLRGGFDPLHVLAALSVIVVGGLLAWRPHKRSLQIAAVVITVAAPLAVAAQQRNRPAPQTGRTLAAELAPAAPLLVTSCEFDHALYEVPRHVITMPAPTEQSTPRADAVWQHTQRTMQPRGLWLVDWFGPADPANWQARQLWQTAAFAGEKSVAGHRALYFRPGLNPTQSGGWQFGDIELTAYTATPAADGVQIALSWQATAPLTQNYSWFVHLLDTDGQLIAQYDRQPQNGYTPTATWQPGDTLTDRLFFPHSDGATVRVGFLNSDGDLLPVTTPDGSPTDANFALLPVTD